MNKICAGFLVLIVQVTHGYREITCTKNAKQCNRDHKKYQKHKDELVADPAVFLKKNRSVQSKFVTRVKSKKPIDAQLLSNLENESPIFALDECLEKNCVNNRYHKKAESRRSICERKIVGIAKNIASKNGNSLTYVGFGSGFCYQDCVIITQLLERGIDNINIFLIDALYTAYLDEDSPKDGTSTDRLHLAFTQFITWIKTVYPDKKARLFVFDSSSQYIEFVSQKPAFQADVIVCLDYAKESGLTQQMILDLKSIIDFNLARNPTAVAFMDFFVYLLAIINNRSILSGFTPLINPRNKAKIAGQNLDSIIFQGIPFSQIFCNNAYLTLRTLIDASEPEDTLFEKILTSGIE